MNFGQGLSDALQAIEIGSEVAAQLDVDAAEIKAKQPASVTIPSIGGSIEGVAGKFTGSVTFTPNT